MKKKGALRNLVPTALFSAPALFLPTARSCFLTPQIFVAFFLFLPILTLVKAFVLFFFCNLLYTANLYKPQSVQTFNQLTSGRQ